MRLAQRGKSGKYKTLKSAVTLTASSTTLLLAPDRQLECKRLARGTYRLRHLNARQHRQEPPPSR